MGFLVFFFSSFFKGGMFCLEDCWVLGDFFKHFFLFLVVWGGCSLVSRWFLGWFVFFFVFERLFYLILMWKLLGF